MSGETTERPFSRTILGAIASVCFVLFGAGLTLWMQTVSIETTRSYTFLAIMTLVFLVSMVVASRSGRFSAGSYDWKLWAAIVIPLLLIVRITVYFGSELSDLDGPFEILSGLLDLTVVLLSIILALTWITGMRVARNIELLHPQQSEVPPSMRSPQYYEWLDSRGRYINRSASIGELNQLAATAGGLLAGLTAFNVAIGSALQNARTVQVSLIIMLLYFVSVLVLLSYANLIRRTSQWSLELASQAPGLTGTWIRSALVLIGLALVIATLIPTMDTSAFVQASIWALEGLLWIARILILFALLILGLFARLFELFRPPGSDTPTSAPTPPPRPGDGTASTIDFSEFLAAMVVVIVSVSALYWAFQSIRRNYRNVVTKHTGRSFLIHLGLILRSVLDSIWAFLRWSQTFAETVGATVRTITGHRRAFSARVSASSTRKPSRTPHQAIHAIYAEVVSEAESQGAHRAPSATPTEYRTHLSACCPGADSSVNGLTELFITARYAPKNRLDKGVEDARRLQADVARALQARHD